MATNWEVRNARTADYLAIKSQSTGYRNDTVAIEAIAARMAARKAAAVKAECESLQARLDKMAAAFDRLDPKPEPVVVIDEAEMRAFKTMCERSYADSEPVYNMCDAEGETFEDYQETYVFRSVA